MEKQGARNLSKRQICQIPDASVPNTVLVCLWKIPQLDSIYFWYVYNFHNTIPNMSVDFITLTESPPVALGELGRGGHHFLSIIAPNDRLYMKFKTHWIFLACSVTRYIYGHFKPQKSTPWPKYPILISSMPKFAFW